ncbi:hypothetical protein [Vreelandella aquamarina]|uniref:hypothetical protein n=1 Tax=Vreelandella aquamarina TaxID=77097 RepID=UPI00273B0562|nr:hypothetical protein [Halomonas meridiana]
MKLSIERGVLGLSFGKAGGGRRYVNCPEGFVKLPIDIWCCKLTGEACSIQASVNPEDEPGFRHGCHADSDKQDKILKTIRTGKYDGFHHVPGRSLCIACEEKGGKKESFYYHFPWEFAELDVAIGQTYEETIGLLAKNGISLSYVMCPLCASCCYEEAVRFDPGLHGQLKVLEFDAYFRS